MLKYKISLVLQYQKHQMLIILRFNGDSKRGVLQVCQVAAVDPDFI